MKRSIQDKLQSTLNEESKNVENKPIGIKDKFSQADQIMQANNEVNKTLKLKIPGKRKTYYFPNKDVELIDKLAQRLWELRVDVNDSELLRVGLSIMNNMTDSELIKECSKIEKALGRKRS